MNHTVTAAVVKGIYEEEVSMTYRVRGVTSPVKKTRAEALQGTRTRVHELLQEQVPCPYQAPPPSEAEIAATGEERNAMIADRRAKLAASIPDAVVLESERARSGPDGTHKDAVHYVQKKHGKSLWEETDRLIAAAGIGGAA